MMVCTDPLPNERVPTTVARRYFTPSGRSIQAKGISPDIEALPY
jgi:C-terminal processing protease CtpA/Prc